MTKASSAACSLEIASQRQRVVGCLSQAAGRACGDVGRSVGGGRWHDGDIDEALMLLLPGGFGGNWDMSTYHLKVKLPIAAVGN